MSEREQKVPRPGDFISGRYLLQELIGEGSSALVFRATDEALGRDVAVKVLRDTFATSEDATARFRAEGRAVAVIAHLFCSTHALVDPRIRILKELEHPLLVTALALRHMGIGPDIYSVSLLR